MIMADYGFTGVATPGAGQNWMKQTYKDPSTGQFNTISYNTKTNDYNVAKFGSTDGVSAGFDSDLGQSYTTNPDGSVIYTSVDNTLPDTNLSSGIDVKTGLAGVQAAAGLAQAYTGLKGLGLAKKQFAFQKAAANRDVANQAKLINESRANSGNVGLALAGNTMSDVQKIAARNKIISNNVDGSAIG